MMEREGSAVARGALLGMAVLVEGGLALAAVGLGLLTGDDPRRTLRGDVADLAWGVATAVPLLVVFGLAYHSRWRPLVELRAQVEGLVRTVFAECSLLDLVVVAVAAGLGEELFFRGWLQAFLERQIGPGWGLAAASLLFGLAHPHSRVYVVMAAGIGLVFGWLWWATGSLLGPVTAHAVYDLVALVWLQRLVGRASGSSAASPPFDPGDGA